MSREWTVMIYMAGDNNLDGQGITDLQDIKRVGSTDEVAILAQFDRAAANRPTHRYYLQHRSIHERISEDVVPPLSVETNTGSPEALTDFIQWGMQEYPAEKYIVIIWGHGTGINDEDIYYSNRMLRRNTKRHGLFRPTLRDTTTHPELVDVAATNSLLNVAASSGDVATDPTLVDSVLVDHVDDPIAVPLIAPDDTNEDFLDNVELKTALINVGQQIDILGMDACLMSMAEVGYQIRESVDFMVASEAEEDVDGWPYRDFLGRLVANPNMSPKTLARTIVEEFDAMYGEVQATAATLSACDLRHPKHEELALRIDQLAAELIDKYDLIKDQILLARNIAWENNIAHSADLVDFCRLLRRRVENAAVKAACTDLINFLKEEGFIFQSAKVGFDVRYTEGLGIYFPMRDLSTLYSHMDMVQTGVTRWREFISRFVNDLASEDHT
jgi:hypothetical protein